MPPASATMWRSWVRLWAVGGRGGLVITKVKAAVAASVVPPPPPRRPGSLLGGCLCCSARGAHARCSCSVFMACHGPSYHRAARQHARAAQCGPAKPAWSHPLPLRPAAVDRAMLACRPRLQPSTTPSLMPSTRRTCSSTTPWCVEGPANKCTWAGSCFTSGSSDSWGRFTAMFTG